MDKKEFIEREAAISAISKVPEGNWSNRRYVAEIEKLPTADVAPVRHGRWVDEKYVWQGQKSAQCNQCKRETGYYTRPEYCPHCGADMREE